MPFLDLSHTIEDGMITYKGLPAPIICDFLSREQSRATYAEGTEFQIGKVELVANTWIAVPIIEGMGYYAVNAKQVGQFAAIPGRHELGDVFERIPLPEERPWKK